jgi:hypothetical protein
MRFFWIKEERDNTLAVEEVCSTVYDASVAADDVLFRAGA